MAAEGGAAPAPHSSSNPPSADPAWAHGIVVDMARRKVQCKYCNRGGDPPPFSLARPGRARPGSAEPGSRSSGRIESESLKYAYAELEESRGAIQFIRFLRRTEGVEAARKYFLDVRKSPNCTYHVYVAYAMMEFCLNKDSKVANNVFENGLKKFMHEPKYILE
ncbi:hypothetical protein Taro_023446 [Colocasia esculenta]|uniref:Suppressor of forked domain-containing protein n=1 Tax=Colocasia esculenta TaxID=4460 RepID=A0A843VBF6_COLES|nr:hypothetical protein [Colocasia esculenta]